MQLAGNAALLAALAPGQQRNFGVSLKFDWDRNGLYANAASDMSAVFEGCSINRQLTGDFPTELDITEGYVAAEMVVTLAGNTSVLDTNGRPVPAWQLFSPYAGYSEGTVGAINTPVTLDLQVLIPLGNVTIRQFTGYVSDGLPDRASANVIVTCYDQSSQLVNPISLRAWAADSTVRTQLSTSNADASDSCTATLSWVIEDVLRRSGVTIGPAWHPNVACAWTLNGSALPEVGTIGIEDPFMGDLGRAASDPGWSSAYGTYNIPQYTPAGIPSAIYGPGQFGNSCFKGASKIPAWPGGRNITYLYGNAHCTYAQAPSNSYGSNNSNLVGMGLWVQIDPTQTGTSTMTVWLEDAQYSYGAPANQYPAYILMTINHATGANSVVIHNEGYSQTWTNNGTTLAAGWHYVYTIVQFTSTAVNCTIYDTGTSIGSGNGGNANPLGVVSYGFPLTGTNLAQVHTHGPAQYAQVWFQGNTPMASATMPTWTQTNPQATVDLSLTRLTWLPDLYQTAAWDILKAAAAGELGVLFIDEQGIVHFQNRATIKANQAAASVASYGRDSFTDISPQSTLASIVNSIPWSVDVKQATALSTVFSSAQANSYPIPINTTLAYPITQSGVQSIRLGAVSWHPEAQGYGNPSNSLEDGGAGPGGTFTYKDWMSIYSPAYWYDGFTAYSPGSTTPGNQPPLGGGLNCVVSLGLTAGDQDSRHMQLALSNSNTSGGNLEFAVDDATAFLHVGGTIITDVGTKTGTVSDAGSITTFGTRSNPLPTSDWHQDPVTVPTIVSSLLADTKAPTPYFQTVEIVGDPRLQLQDVVTLLDPGGMGATMPASVIGISRTIDTQGGVKDVLTLRTF
jgi:hypothetical protein